MNSIVWFDLETTGVDVTTDRIIEISMIKTDLNGNEIDRFYSLVNPDGVKSRPEAIEKHGITDEMLTDAPLFSEIAKTVFDFIGDSALGGYNVQRYDIPLLLEEFYRCKIIFKYRNRPIIDPLMIVIKKEPRDLSSLYKRLVDKELIGAHRAQADVEATIEIFNKQKDLYSLDDDLNEIDKEINDNEGRLDYDNKFIMIDGEEGINSVVFNFGKWKGTKFIDVYKKNRDYIEWMIEKGNFLTDTKIIARKLINRIKSN